jgi:hypothetical protein
MSKPRKLLIFLISIAMIGGGLYMLVAETFWAEHHFRKIMLAGVLLVLLGGYLIWADIIAPVLGIKTPEAAFAGVITDDAKRPSCQLANGRGWLSMGATARLSTGSALANCTLGGSTTTPTDRARASSEAISTRFDGPGRREATPAIRHHVRPVQSHSGEQDHQAPGMTRANAN